MQCKRTQTWSELLFGKHRQRFIEEESWTFELELEKNNTFLQTCTFSVHFIHMALYGQMLRAGKHQPGKHIQMQEREHISLVNIFGCRKENILQVLSRNNSITAHNDLVGHRTR